MDNLLIVKNGSIRNLFPLTVSLRHMSRALVCLRDGVI